ncbi:MAG: bifunctional ornithine acetyltransferase/N-acetylglutamate synthase, partial [bacterium]
AKNEVLLASTGVIGRPLPVEKIKKGIKKISRSFAGKPEDAVSFAESILTTDTRRKICATDDFWACAKGSGMIAPDMATFLCFILTDACVPPVLMKRVLSESIRPFNTMTVDGEMSTNDSVFLLSTGKRKITPLKFGEGLNGVCRVLSEKIIADGEGATKVITVSVKSARNRKDARFLARFLANSPLIKTAFNGESPNWGRIFSRVGASGVAVNEKRMSISICGVSVFRGAPVKFDGLSLERQLMRKNVSFEVDISMGKERCSFRTTDLSAEYVKINAGYAT